MRGVVIATGTNVDADALAVLCGKSIEHLVIQRNKVSKQSAQGVKLQRQPGFSEVDLHAGCPGIERASDVQLSLIDQIREKLIARIARDRFRWVKEAERGRRYDRLLDWQLRIATRRFNIRGGMHTITERPRSQPRQLPRMAVCKRDDHSIGREIG